MKEKKTVKKADEQKADQQITCALIDEQNIYRGLVTVNESEITDLHLPQIRDCDLVPGKYRWEANAVSLPFGGTFIPIKQDRKPLPLDALGATALGFIGLAAQGSLVPQQTLEWAQRYLTTIDQMTNLDKGK